VGIAVAILFFVVFVYAMFKRFKRVPPGKVMVIFGKMQDGSSSNKYLLNGAAFIWPIIQDYTYLDLTPINMKIDLKGAFSKENIRVDVSAKFTSGISTDPEKLDNAVERLLGLDTEQIVSITEDLLMGQFRMVIANLKPEELSSTNEQFLHDIQRNVEPELNKIGLELINVNVTDIKIRN
ncbi:flotillin family protein, partial [Crocinitomix catalasitica]|nr:flotillin family protein [Crocinitomix catalasitica]